MNSNCNDKTKYPTLLFPDISTSRKILSTSDCYTKSFGKFDLQSKLQSDNENLTEQDYLNNTKKYVREWDTKDKERIISFYNNLKKFFDEKRIKLNLPSVIKIIKTTGEEEDGASGYVREGNIVMKHIENNEEFEQLFYHEFWHVATYNDKNLAKFVYSRYQYFYDNCRKIVIPNEIKNFRISNPDIFGRNVYLKALLNEEVTQFYPMLISNENYTTATFFNYLYVVLFAVENKGNKKIFKKDSSGNYIVLKVIRFAKNPGNQFKFLDNLEEKKIGYTVEKILGYNSPYILGHPEESLAEMFKFLVYGNWKDKKSSELICALLNDLINYKSITSNTFNI